MGGIYDDTLAPHYIERGIRFVLAGMDQSFLIAAAISRARLLSGAKG